MVELSFLAKHSVIYGVGNLLAKGVAFLLLPLYTKYLTPADYGVLELLETSTMMIGTVIGIGLTNAMTRFYYEQATDQLKRVVVSTTLLLVAACSLVVVSIASGAAGLLAQSIFSNPKFTIYFIFSFTSLGLGVLVDVLLVYLRIQQRSMAYVAISLTNLVLTVAGALYFVVVLQQGVIGILTATLIVKAFLCVCAVIYMLFKVGCRFNLKLAKSLFAYSMPLIPSEAMNMAIGYSDRFFINHYISVAAAGIYSVTQKLGTMLHVLVTSPFILTFLPRRFEIANRDDGSRTLATVYQAYMLVMVTLTTALSVCAPLLVAVATDSAYHSASLFIPLTAASMVLLGMKYHFQFGILHAKKTRYIMYTNAVCLVVQLSGNALLIPVLGLWGAILAFIITQLVTLAMYLHFSQREYRIDFALRWSLLLIISGLFAYAAKEFLPKGTLTLDALGAAEAMVVYMLALIGLRVISIGRIRSLAGVLMRARSA